MKLSKILILWTSVTAGALCASEAPWFERSGEKLAQKHPQMTRVLKETGTRVIACDGKTTCFQAPQAANLPEKFTWAVWFRPEVQPGNGTILCKTGYHHMLRVNKRGQFGLIYYLASNKIQYLFPEPLPADQWYFGVLVCDGERLSLYINGEKVAQQKLSEKLKNLNSHYFFAAPAPNADPADHFKGDLDYIRIWNTALNPQEIMDLFLEEEGRYIKK